MPFLKTRSCHLVLLMLVTLAFGCRDKGNAKLDGPIRQNVKDFDGNWIIIVTNRTRNIDEYRWLVNFSRDSGGKIVGKMVDARQDKNGEDPPSVESVKVNDNAIRVVFKNARGNFDFEGELKEGYIRGNLRATPTDIFMSRMLPTDETSLERINASGPFPGSEQVEQMLKSKELKPDMILTAAQEMRNSPISHVLFDMILARAAISSLEESKFGEILEETAAAASVWGDRWVARVELELGTRLINGRNYVRLAPAHLDACEEKLGEDLEVYRDTLKRFRELAEILICSQDIQSDSTSNEVRQKAYLRLKEFAPTHLFSFDILYGIATQAERNGEDDLLYTTLSEVVATPLLEGQILGTRAGQPPTTPGPSEKLKAIWVKKHGSEDGYEKYIDDVYHKILADFTTEIQQKVPGIPAADAGNKTVLVELFTCMRNAIAVPAEVAVAAAAQVYPTTKVIALEYHQHLPEPDGLVNQDSEERAAFYEVPSTPLIIINGSIVIPQYYSGLMQNAIKAYEVLRAVIDPELAGQTEIELKLTGTIVNGELSVSAEAIGVPEARLASCRLRMAIVENHVSVIAPLQTNGIRDHRYVVREMLGGTKGIPAKDGELKYSMTMPIEDLQRHVIDYMARYEAGRRFELPAALKPPIRGPLSFVAWVQDGQPDRETNAKRILQSTIIPISGEFELIGGGKVESGIAETTPAAEVKVDETSSAQNKSSTPDNKAPDKGNASDKAANSAAADFPPAPALPE